MHNRKSIIVAIAVIIVLVAGFFTYSQIHDQAAQNKEQDKLATSQKAQQDKATKDTSNNNNNKVKNDDQSKTVKKSIVPKTDPTKGEKFVEGKVKTIDVEKRIITIDQHMDDNSQTIDPNVPVLKDAIIQDKTSDIAINQIKTGDVVSMVITPEGQARAVLVNY